MWHDIPEDLNLQDLPAHAENFLLLHSSDFYVIVCHFLKLMYVIDEVDRLWCLLHFLCVELSVHAGMNPVSCLPYICIFILE